VKTPSESVVWTVSGLNHEVKTILEQGIGTLWLEGEISNFARPASGHWYFSLKDDRAQIRSAMFKGRNQRLAFQPENGDQVRVRAQVSLYEARGDYQLIVEHLEAAGSGQLMQQFEQRKEKLQAEGLFAPEHKQTLPQWPQRLGVITSESAAALRDVLHVLARRAPWIEVLLIPASVQGEKAPAELLRALELAQTQSLDALLLVRGGGSIEDLWAFNDEALVRAVFSCRLPLVSGVGHETDFSLCDFAADERAPTPSAAAERLSPDQYELRQRLDELQQRVLLSQKNRLRQQQQRMQQLQQRLMSRHPLQNLRWWRQQLHQQSRLLQLAWQRRQQQWQQQSERQQWRLLGQNPQLRLGLLHQKVQSLLPQLWQQQQHLLQDKRHQFQAQVALLDAYNPLQRMQQGYCRASDADGRVVKSVSELKTGDLLQLQFADGRVHSQVDQVVSHPLNTKNS